MNTNLTYQEILIYDELEQRYLEQKKTKWIDNNYATFETEKEAEIVIKKLTPPVYTLSYGEHDAPDYTAQPYKGKFVIFKECYYWKGICGAEKNHILCNWEIYPQFL